MKSFSTRISFTVVLLLAMLATKAQNAFFKDATEGSFRQAGQKRVIIPKRYRTVDLSSANGLVSFLGSLPSEKNIFSRAATPTIEIPMPDGTTARFHVWESSAMEPALAAAHPDIKTFTGQGIDDPTATIKLDWSEFGFHAMILSATTGAVFIDPYDQKTTTHYISYYKSDFKKAGEFTELPPIKNKNAARPAPGTVLAGEACVGTQLRTYRLAIACTHQYAAAATGLDAPTKAQVLAKIVTSANRVNGIYEKELSVRLVLIATETEIIFNVATGDPFTGNDNAVVLIDESQSIITQHIGPANFDIGHTFSTGGGGYAAVGVICQSGSKASGITGSPNPVGDAYDVDYVAHEIGHQFGASHTFNSDLSGTSCAGNGSSSANAEPGSGSTIMAYAGICGSDDLQPHSDPQFHAISLDEIAWYTISGVGNNCAVITATGNTPPVVNAGADYIIPKSTPFFLTGSATDANGDALTYDWEQVDVGGPFGVWNSPSGDAPLFRSFTAKTTPTRYFPKLSDVLSNTTTIGEIMASYARTMHFRLTARDNRAGGGGVCSAENAVTVDGASGPFVITAPNTSGISWQVNDFQTITWNPAGSAGAPVNCANVKIELSTDGGNTFPVVILASTPNDGSEEILVPNNITTTARIRISAVGNIFYDISNANFSIQNSGAAAFVFSNPPAMAGACGADSLVCEIKTAPLNGFSTPIKLTASGNPAGTTVTLGASTVNPGTGSTIVLHNTASLSGGTYNITVTGVAGSVTKTRIVPFVVKTLPGSPSILTPGDGASGINVLPSFTWSAVAGASSYTLEISTSPSFTPAVQTISGITTTTRALTTALAENAIYYWRVTAVTDCGKGPVSSTDVFKTGIFTCKNSTDVPKTISPDGTPTVTSTITIPAVAGVTIADLNVLGLMGTHSYINDLTVTLTSPKGTKVVLFDSICVSGAENFNLNLDDEATLAIPCPPTGGKTVKPQHPLSAFDGESSAGVWTLTIKDRADQDGGSLTGWGLAFNNCDVIATSISTQLCASSSGTSLISDVSGATYQWQVNTGAGFANITNNANYAGATTSTLQISSAPTSWYGYQYRCVVGGTNSSVSTIGFANYWKGTVNNAWENSANWSCNAIPDGNTDVIISSGAVVVKSSAMCRSIKVSPSASVTVNTGFKITVTH